MTEVWVRFVVRLATEFRFETIPRNRVGKVSVIPQKKVLISRFTEESIPKLGMERNYMKIICFEKKPAPANRIESATAGIPPEQTTSIPSSAE